MIRYDLAKMLEEIKADDGGGGKGAQAKKPLTQEEIKALARGRRKAVPAKAPSK
jgi:hypothetical protein